VLENDILIRKLGNDGILRLILNDSMRRNALSEEMLRNLGAALAEASVTSAVRVVVLAARGPAFCAGHDLKELTNGRDSLDGGKAYFSKIMTLCSGVMQTIVNCPKPVIAEVAGVATAAGCQLVASCDLAVAADTAQFSTPGVHIGLFCSTPMVALSRNVSNKHAMEMLLTGDVTTAHRAAEMGLVNRVVAPGILTTETMELARKIASKSSMALATGKQAFYQQREMSLSEAYSYATGVMVENMLTVDATEGIGAFIEKRPARWLDQ
jgi:enoyl-CoA hydratase/carnithine racemase